VPFFDSNGVSIHYEVFGEGEPIILIHGFASNLQENWVATGWVDTLMPLRQVIALDCRGHGKSDRPREPEAYSSDSMSGDVIAVLDHLGIARADLFGYSMGGGIVLRLLAGYPDRFASAIAGGVGERNNHELQALDGLRGGRARSPSAGPGLPSLTPPVLIVNGADDRAVGSPDGIVASIPTARVMQIPGCDHLSVVADQRFKDAVVAFLRDGA
jgi:pimeloyl-ACP methyl ester carboxylesterase